MQITTGHVVEVGGVRRCRNCSGLFRFMNINGGPGIMVDAVDNNGIGIRVTRHECGQDQKALRATISRCKMMVGRAVKCRGCGFFVRQVYIFSTDAYWLVNDPGMTPAELLAYDGPLISHECSAKAGGSGE